MSKRLLKISFQALCIAVGILIMLPVVYAISLSFMRPEEILSGNLQFFPKSFYLGNYISAFTKTTLPRFLFNSLIVTVGACIARVITASTAAFAFSFMEFKGKQTLFMLFIGTMMIPADLLIVQNYSTVSKLGLINTYLGIMIVFFVSVVNVFVMRQHFLAYSSSVREAAMIDGCSNGTFFFKVLLPSSKSVLITTFISSFVGVWNQYLWPLLVTNSNEMRTAQVAITLLNFPDGSPHGIIMAAAMIILVPSVAVFLIFQRHIKKGMMAGSVKG